jgi:hypothetical protein
MTKLTLIPLMIATLAGSVSADDKDKKAPAPPADKKAPPADKKAPDAKPVDTAAKPPEMPKPAPELVEMAKAMNGTWKCTGQADLGGSMGDVKATISHKADLDNFWIQTSFTGTAGKLPPFKFTMLTTYDAASKKFWRTRVTGRGGHAVEWGTAAGTKVSWEGDARMMGNDIKTRETEEMVSPKEVHVVGEMSKDGGKTWTKDHDATCKK